jgi:hypothetical protein
MSQTNHQTMVRDQRRIDDDGGIGGGGQKLERFPTLSAKECHPFFFFSLSSLYVSKVFQKPHEKPRQ